jgi:hypothetical protein
LPILILAAGSGPVLTWVGWGATGLAANRLKSKISGTTGGKKSTAGRLNADRGAREMPTFPPQFPDPLKKERRVTITPDGHVIYGDFSISLMRLEQILRDPKASTWALMLLYPASALLILIGLQPANPSICAFAQCILLFISGVWIAWVSIRLFIRENFRIWFRYVLLVLVVIGLGVGLLATAKLPNLYLSVLCFDRVLSIA